MSAHGGVLKTLPREVAALGRYLNLFALALSLGGAVYFILHYFEKLPEQFQESPWNYGYGILGLSLLLHLISYVPLLWASRRVAADNGLPSSTAAYFRNVDYYSFPEAYRAAQESLGRGEPASAPVPVESKVEAVENRVAALERVELPAMAHPHELSEAETRLQSLIQRLDSTQTAVAETTREMPKVSGEENS